MPEYAYWANTEIGDVVSGTISAATPDAAAHLLTLRGLTVRRLEILETSEPADAVPVPMALSDEDFDAVTSQLELITRRHLPLVASLRILAEEAPQSRTRNAVMHVLSEMENGEPFEKSLGNLQEAFPKRMAVLFEAGAKSGRMTHLMENVIDHFRRSGIVRRQILMKLSYPLFVLLIAFFITTTIVFSIVPQFAKIYDDFGTELPAITQILVNVSRQGWAGFLLTLILGGLILGGLLFALTLFGGQRKLQQFFRWIPLIGGLFQAASLSGFLRMVSILVEEGFPLTEAFQLAGVVTDDGVLAKGAEHIVSDLNRGIALIDAVRVTEAFPRDVLPVFRWAEKQSLFIKALRGAADIYESRARLNSGFIAIILEPLVFVSIGFFLGTVIVALFMPLIKLLNDLS